MFFPGSRYETAGTYTTIRSDGRPVVAVRIPVPRSPRLLGYHRRVEGRRLDHIAAHYLGDATAFWRLCDVSGTILPDALAARQLVGVPVKGD
jgi:hypothetical protein